MGVKEYQQYLNFSGGINANDGQTLIADTQVTDALNVIFGNGFAKKRFGYEQYSTNILANPIKSLYEYKRNNGVVEFLMASGTTLYKDVGGTLTSITGTLTSSTVKFLTYKDRSVNDITLIADGGSLKAYNGTSVSAVTPRTPTTSEATDPGVNDLANLTNCRALAIKRDRIFLVGHPTVKNRVHFSWIDPTIGYAVYDYFPAIYFFDVAVEDNDEIVALKVFRNQLIIFCKKSVWALKGDGSSLVDLELIKINVPKGCIAPNTIQEVGNNLFYLADDHVYSIFASEQEFISAQLMSVNVKPILDAYGLSDKTLATSTVFEGRYWLTFPDGITLVYDPVLECWTKFDKIKANSFLVRDGVLYFGAGSVLLGALPNKVYRFNQNKYSDDGAIINYLLKTKIYNFDLPVNRKKYKRLWIIQKQFDGYHSSYTLNGYIDGYSSNILNTETDSTDFTANVSATWDSSTWDNISWDFAETVQQKTKIQKQGKDIQLSIENKKVDEPLSIYGFIFEYEVRKAK